MGTLIAAAMALGKGAIWLYNYFVGSKPTAEERLGQEETKNENSVKALSEVEGAVDARESSRASDAPGVLRDGSDPAAAPYRPGPD